jgi:hypothetical protein
MNYSIPTEDLLLKSKPHSVCTFYGPPKSPSEQLTALLGLLFTHLLRTHQKKARIHRSYFPQITHFNTLRGKSFFLLFFIAEFKLLNV